MMVGDETGDIVRSPVLREGQHKDYIMFSNGTVKSFKSFKKGRNFCC